MRYTGPIWKMLLTQRKYFNERPMLWGIPGALVGALLALRLGGRLLLVLGLVTLALGACLLLAGEGRLRPAPAPVGLLLLRGAVLPQGGWSPGNMGLRAPSMDEPEREAGRPGRVLGPGDPGRPAGAGSAGPHRPLRRGPCLRGRPVPQGPGGAGGRSGRSVGLSTVLYGGPGPGQHSSGRAGGPAVRPGPLLPERLEAAADALFSDQAGPAKGMLFGDKDDIHYLTFRAFRRSGLLHLLTVSGLHVGVVCGAALRLIRGRRKWLRFLLSVLLLFLFCLLTGLSPSSLRAAIMLLAVWFSHLLDRQDDPISVIGCAWTLLLLANPFLLASSGFRLSFGAIWGLCCLAKPLPDLLHGRREGLGGCWRGRGRVSWASLPLLSPGGRGGVPGWGCSCPCWRCRRRPCS